MRRGLTLIIILSLIAALSMWAADRPGRLVIDWQGWRIETSVLVLALAALALTFLTWISARIWNWLWRGHALSPERRNIRRLSRGLETMDKAMAAMAAGDAKSAHKLAEEAVKKLPDSAIARVLAAQSASQMGDQKAVDAHYLALEDSARGKLISLRGQILTARRKGESTKAIELLRQAQNIAPKSAWAAQTAFELATESGDWHAAEDALQNALKLGVFTPELALKHRSALNYGRAVDAEAKGEGARALQLALKSHKQRPDFAPATLLAARLLKAAGQIRRAAKLIENGWEQAPHPTLGELYALLWPTETATTRLARFKKLTSLNPNHRESRLRLAEAALGAQDLTLAIHTLEPLTSAPVAARTARLMLAICEAQGSDARTQSHWADLASKGAGEPLWVCDTCGSERTRWLAHCPSCQSFNSFSWDPKERLRSGAIDTDAIPLIGASPHL